MNLILYFCVQEKINSIINYIMENTENLKKTVFNEMHREMGAKMVPFAGFDMPVQFEGVNIEHETVRKGVGVFDVSHMGEFRAKGPKAFAFVQRCTTNVIRFFNLVGRPSPLALVRKSVKYTFAFSMTFVISLLQSKRKKRINCLKL